LRVQFGVISAMFRAFRSAYWANVGFSTYVEKQTA
jgi:hypothetical protein